MSARMAGSTARAASDDGDGLGQFGVFIAAGAAAHRQLGAGILVTTATVMVL